MGAAIPLTDMLNPLSVYGRGANGVTPEITFVTLVAMPLPVTVPSPQGTKPGAKLAAFTKLLAVTDGPGNVTVSETVDTKVPAVAVMETLPAVEPAVGVVLTWPEELVVPAALLKVADPAATLNVT